jgi:hypothetical protein
MSGKSKTRLVVISIFMFGILAISLTGIFSRPRLSQAAVAKGQDGQSELRALLTERREVLQNLVHRMETFLESGRIGIDEFMDANVELVRAELDLCENKAERFEVLQKTVQFLTTCEGMVAKRAAAGRATEIDMGKARAAVLAAKIELARERMTK